MSLKVAVCSKERVDCAIPSSLALGKKIKAWQTQKYLSSARQVKGIKGSKQFEEKDLFPYLSIYLFIYLPIMHWGEKE